MNDVASTSLVRVIRPAELLPIDFSVAMADLQTMGFLRIGAVSREDAWVDVLKRAEERDDVESPVVAASAPAPASPSAPRTLRGREEKPAMMKSRIDEVFAAVEKGVSRSADIAEQLGMGQSHCGKYLRELIESGRVEHRGNRVTSRFYVKGRAPAEATTTLAGGPAPRAAKPRPKKSAAMVHVPKVSDLTPAPAGSSARFTLRYFESHVECATANDVAELLVALRGLGR